MENLLRANWLLPPPGPILLLLDSTLVFAPVSLAITVIRHRVAIVLFVYSHSHCSSEDTAGAAAVQYFGSTLDANEEADEEEDDARKEPTAKQQ
ncbi:hypothetical protein TYRP_007005 [Tyrophagus putrescentiae]|nr:hypothetical protein TYRP_007005 [Tyrophagus putrescentiae]